MYKNPGQIALADFIFPYGKLKEDNRWVKMAAIIPWAEIECKYAARFADVGAPAHSARMALGAVIAKQVLHCSDRELCDHVSENPYLQYFLGLSEFSEICPFVASTLVTFRARFSEADIACVNEAIIAKATEKASNDNLKDDDDSNNDNHDDNSLTDGVCDDTQEDEASAEHVNDSIQTHELTLSLDATVAPSDIAYPQDMRLLDEARRKLECAIDLICKETKAKKAQDAQANRQA